jgi:hypothetical protein
MKWCDMVAGRDYFFSDDGDRVLVFAPRGAHLLRVRFCVYLIRLLNSDAKHRVYIEEAKEVTVFSLLAKSTLFRPHPHITTRCRSIFNRVLFHWDCSARIDVYPTEKLERALKKLLVATTLFSGKSTPDSSLCALQTNHLFDYRVWQHIFDFWYNSRERQASDIPLEE